MLCSVPWDTGTVVLHVPLMLECMWYVRHVLAGHAGREGQQSCMYRGGGVTHHLKPAPLPSIASYYSVVMYV